MSKLFSGEPDAEEASPDQSVEGGLEPETPEEDEGGARIARTGMLLREQTKWLRSQEKARRKAPARRVSDRPPRTLTAGLSDEEKNALIEVTDQHGGTLACLRPESAVRQKLSYRLVSVALFRQGTKLALHKRVDANLGKAGCWDLHTSFILVGEAGEDAALRVLRQAGLEGISVKPLDSQRQESRAGEAAAYFRADMPAGLYPLRLLSLGEEAKARESGEGGEEPAPLAELLEVDADEFAGIVGSAPELFSPEVLWAAGRGLLFGKAKTMKGE